MIAELTSGNPVEQEYCIVREDVESMNDADKNQTTIRTIDVSGKDCAFFVDPDSIQATFGQLLPSPLTARDLCRN